MKEYEFAVTFHLTEGTFYEEAESVDEAYDKAWATIQNALKELPVEVEYEVECVNDDAWEEEEPCEQRCETCNRWERDYSYKNKGVCMKYAGITNGNDECSSWIPLE